MLTRTRRRTYFNFQPFEITSTSILILFSRLGLGIQGSNYLSGFATTAVQAFLIAPMHAAFPAQLALV